MVAALILDRDFLGVKFINHKVKKYFFKKTKDYLCLIGAVDLCLKNNRHSNKV
jgi:hypothetical protein